MNKSILITGSNSGVGKGAASQLAEQDNEIIMLCRNKEKAELVRQEIIQQSGNTDIQLYIADFSSFNDVRNAAGQVIENYSSLDVLVNNAGVIELKRQMNHHNMERSFAVNHLAHFLLTHDLASILKKSNDPQVISTSSAAHFAVRRVDFSDINYENHWYTTFGAYGRSKLANLLFTYKLDRDVEWLSANAIHPGFVGSNFAKNNGIVAKMAMLISRPITKSIYRGSRPIIHLINTNLGSGLYVQDSNPLNIGKSKIKAVPSSKLSYDLELQDELWSISTDLINPVIQDPLSWN
ncbi:MAG: SDR family NAD(P)-dependent oxidoreductase [Candidatus Heimdallarchaeota archaeon]|nr:SDR family NAD(P)-dependent oxidoreductase [Candidatus Heimdallarchaeota archaeon]